MKTHVRSVPGSKLTLSSVWLFPSSEIQPSLFSAPGEQLYLLSMFSLDTQKENDKTKGVCLGKAGQNYYFESKNIALNMI